MSRKPDSSVIPEMYTRYINLVREDDFIKTMNDSRESTLLYLQGLTPDQWMHTYAPGKWTPKK